MKKILYILAFFILIVSSLTAQKVCCPEFGMVSSMGQCYYIPAHPTGGSGTGDIKPEYCQSKYTGCKHSKETFAVFPQKVGYTYTWTVTGGTITSGSGNSKDITWGKGSLGTVTVVISNPSGTCKQTITEKVCLIDAPTAGFSFTPNSSVCANQLVQFNDASTGAKTWNWDFGDGTTSTQVNPSHSYTTPGTYTITLTVSNAVESQNTGIDRPCSCSDTMTKTITVGAIGIEIIPGCKQMLCKGDKASYSTASPCNNYNWSVTGGHIDGSSTSEAVNVIWDGSYPATVTMTGICLGKCGNSGTLSVPVLYPTMPISGSTVVCPSDFSSYSLASMPGTNYTWTISGGGTIAGDNADTSVINVNWGTMLGDYTITCNYANAMTKCSGTATIKVKILPPFKITGSANGCLNSSFSYSANSPANWTITPTSGTSSSTFSNVSSISGTWTAIGSFTINAIPVTPANFCSYPDSMVVTVLPTPILGPITGPILICPGKPYTYNVTSNRPGGTFNWTVTGGSYTSSGGNNSSITVTWNATGPYSLAVNQTIASCSAPNNQTLNVNAYAIPVITGSVTSCMDNELIYNTSTIAAPGDYSWSLSNALGTIISGQGTNTIHVMWHGSLTPPNTCIVKLLTCGGPAQITVTINAAPPVVITKTGALCSTSGITLSSSITGTSYVWQLDNIVQPTLTTQNVVITSPGTYTVSVKGTNGCISKGSIVIPKENTGFTANIAATNKTYWLCTETISTNLVATPMPAGTYCYKWFQSSALIGVGSPVGTASNYTATSTGYFWCEVSICGTSCKVNTNRVLIEKENCVPGGGNCNSNYNPDFTINTACNPYSFSTTNVPYSGGSAYWYFGDGTNDSGANVTHTYTGIGTYSVCASFGNSTYCRKDICKTVTVNLAANFTASVNCDKVTFTNLCQVQAPSTIVSYNWSFPGGSPATSSAANPGVITYSTGGIHTATLTVSDGHCPVTFSDTYTTTAIPASMNIPTTICANTVVPFKADGSNPDTTYQWNFGDGFISNLQNTGHTYIFTTPPASFPVSKIVTLTVTNKNGCSTVLTQNINIYDAITASIIGGDKKLCPNGIVSLSVTPSFTIYQWYKDGIAISGATAATYNASQEGIYYVQVGNGTGGGCTADSNKSTVSFYPLPIAKIIASKTQCSDNYPIQIQNSTSETGATYAWTVTGPSPLTLGNTANPTATTTVPGEYNFELTVTSKEGCIAKDAICITLVKSPTLTITAPTGPLCEGKKYTFTAIGTPNTNPSDYTIQWSNGVIGNTMTTGVAGSYSATIVNSAGCTASAFGGTIKRLPDVSLFPKGCQTLCWTETINFPLLKPATGTYTVTWYDDDGTAVANVGSGLSLPLSTLQPGIHHLHATVSVAGGCEVTTGILDLNIKDCTLLPECDNCKDLLSTTKVESENNITSTAIAQITDESITFTILKPVKEVRISLADIKYYWKDPACANCKIQMIERGCLFAAMANQALGTLVADVTTSSNVVTSATANKCPDELIWNGGTVLQPGTYTIPLQLSLPKPTAKNCVLVLEKACFHLSLIDEDCKKCETIFCKKDTDVNPKDCACNAGNNWSNLFLTPSKSGIAKPRTQIICGDTMTDIQSDFAYNLSGVYNCKGNCASTKNEITVYNQVNDIIYTHVATALYETIVFPSKGMYSVTLTANCGGIKCSCSFRINVNSDGGGTVSNGNSGGNDDNQNPSNTTSSNDKPIEDILNQTLPPDFNGQILVSQNDKTLFEKNYSFKDNVTSHTAFDLASITKTFTAMAVLKLMEDGKLKIEDPVVQYLPQFPIPEITLKMLLSHKSGLEDYLKFIDESDWDKKKNLTNADLLQFIVKNKSKVLINTPGEIFDYSNTNFALLALIIEKVSGESYKEYLGNTFFKPLQMSDTYLMGLDNYALATKSYYRNGKIYSLRYLDLVYGDKNIYSTVQDLKKWDKALRDGKLFKKTTLDLAYAPTSTLVPYASNYGLGWKKIVTTSGKEVLYHTGWWAGNRSLLIRLPKDSVMIAVVSNNNFINISDIKKLCDLFGDYQLTNKKIDNF
ncbi:serine hydrolase [Flavobacterium muglaense]|uniref:Serine hydrolase n=1 Tax=Flavobacterium muglaense TaxID=2764716 RepID=A0A923N1M3_9FLAO|nr:serine hydrolase [Flavobacterium muglaense]MBC5837540.1 serine hydrolase [Flavobacterium muglaense]MBC5844043.1 serine hydrolase [Flavobacterium muglaense]